MLLREPPAPATTLGDEAGPLDVYSHVMPPDEVTEERFQTLLRAGAL